MGDLSAPLGWNCPNGTPISGMRSTGPAPHPAGLDAGLERLSSAQMFPAHGAPIRVTLVAHDGTVALHDHDFIEVVVVISGTALHHTVGGSAELQRGDAFLLLPGQWHGYERAAGLRIFNCCFGVGILSRELAWVRHDPLVGALFPARLPGPGEMSVATRQEVIALQVSEEDLGIVLPSLEALLNLTTGAGDRVRERAEEIAYLLLVLGRVARVRGDFARAAGQPSEDPAIAAVMLALEERLEHPWTLDALAQRANLSRSYLVRLFRRRTGLSPMAWLAQRRAERAAVLLLTTNKGVADIGVEVGWADPGYFARRFRSAFGMPASQYRTRFPLPMAGLNDNSHKALEQFQSATVKEVLAK